MVKKTKPKPKSNTTTIAIIVVIAIVAVAFLATNRQPLTQTPQTPSGTDQTNPQNQQPYQPPYQQPVNFKAPTSLTAAVSPNPMTMSGFIYGTVVSNGYNYPITIYAKHLGKGTETTIPGFIGPDGKFELAQQLNTPGYWQFWATSDSGIKSNIASLTCQGIQVSLESGSYSKTFRDSLIVEVYSNFVGNCALILNDPTHSVSYPLTNTVTNAGGYGSVSISFDPYPNGDDEVDAIIFSHKASDYGGSAWIDIGR